MERELVIKASSEAVEIAFLEDKTLVELHQEEKSSQFTVGDILLARVKKTVPSLNAAFVDVGYHRDAFLHYTDLGPNIRTFQKYVANTRSGKQQTHLLDKANYEKEIVKTGKITEVLSKGDLILTQILKEPISSKGPRLSCEITLPGRFLVLAPFSSSIGISKRISSRDERKRLKRLIESIKPKNFGVIVRTVAEGKSVSDLHEDMQNLMKNWEKIYKKLPHSEPPETVLSELSRTTSILRDLMNASFNRVTVDDDDFCNEIRNYIEKISPGREKIVKCYNGKKPLFDHYGITKQIKAAFGNKVTLPSGIYLIIEHTEALHVIDVNSGYKTSPKDDQETSALKVNMEAAKEIARQLRLRDLGGIIVVDFIDMKKPDNKKALYQYMIENMKNDRAQHTIMPLTKFNLMQITRERVRPEIKITTSETCPCCEGTGKIGASLLLADDLEHDLDFLVKKQNQTGLTVLVHPFIDAYIKKGVPSKQMKWFVKYGNWVKVQSDENLPITKYCFLDKEGEEIEVQ